ncbi:MAG: CvpA family protein [Gammaproteobacteria bacterium]|uniref:CvpA family protein n=1 Tax=Pseudomaricurvus alcaniphilus TaxID=1166482 RepID=UPI0014077C8E|nr:CvpA family protein [Pseudomaricurvus alcaniphilus]MBR9912066.1 CvpA family protein [Gammaproteobacteria bacterium]NHN37456.1 CvpA family protein [Pseudomaricurvus alcaniphilus]
MNWADWIIIGILAISCLIGLKRGLVKEAMSLLCWIAAFLIAWTFHKSLATLLGNLIDTASVRHLVAFAGLFIATLIVGALVNYLIGELIRITGLSGTDRLLGMVFGLARGGAVVLALVLLVPMIIPVQQDSWWQQSQVIPHFVAMEGWASSTWSQLTSGVAALFQSGSG